MTPTPKPAAKKYIVVKNFTDGSFLTEFFHNRSSATDYATAVYNRRHNTSILEDVVVYEPIMRWPCKTDDPEA